MRKPNSFCRCSIHERGVTVYWVDLPPRLGGKEGWEWGLFSKKNEMARELLEPFGLTYLETGPALLRRIIDEKAVFGDEYLTTGLHWCSPGPYAAPTHILTLIMHDLTTNQNIGGGGVVEGGRGGEVGHLNMEKERRRKVINSKMRQKVKRKK